MEIKSKKLYKTRKYEKSGEYSRNFRSRIDLSTKENFTMTLNNKDRSKYCCEYKYSLDMQCSTLQTP